eukprot:1795852-Prymnesium_polylepis.1
MPATNCNPSPSAAEARSTDKKKALKTPSTMRMMAYICPVLRDTVALSAVHAKGGERPVAASGVVRSLVNPAMRTAWKLARSLGTNTGCEFSSRGQHRRTVGASDPPFEAGI